MLLDTLDLQDHDTPSAKDHTKQPETPAPLGGGRPAPHQELSIRHADEDSKAEMKGGPRADGHGMYEDEDGGEGDMEQNGHYDHEDDDLADGESDDLLDDDLMDKISSSPSIDDGGFTWKMPLRKRVKANCKQRTLILNLFTLFTTSSQLLMDRQMQPKEIPWFFWMTVIAIGGWFVWSRTEASVSPELSKNPKKLLIAIRLPSR